MKEFFNLETNKNIITDYIKMAYRFESNNEFEKERNGHIVNILTFMTNDPQEWDKNTQFNISDTSTQLKVALTKNQSESEKNDKLNVMLVILFSFYSEYQLYKPIGTTEHYSSLKHFLKNNLDEFPENLSAYLNYIWNEMPSAVLKFLMSSADFATIRNFIEVKKEADILKESWDAELSQKKTDVDNLKESLESYKDGFNFVALYAGFKNLGDAKQKELGMAKFFVLVIGAIIPVIIAAGFWHLVTAKTHSQNLYDLIYFIPATALSAILIYYFRISLSNYNSLRAQKMQIELRKSLCQFIQEYSRYSSEISKENPGLLVKFEEVIFSNIMTSEDKIPSTFDGIEQIANLIKAVKTKGS